MEHECIPGSVYDNQHSQSFKSDLLMRSATEQVEARKTRFALILLLTIIQKESIGWLITIIK